MRKTIEVNTTALELICNLHIGMSKQKAKKMIQSSTFLINGKAIKTIPSTVLEAGQKLEIVRNTKTDFKHQHPEKNRPVVIKFEDDHFIVAIKPVGILSCKSEEQRGIAFDQILKEYISKRDGTKTQLWIAHRIDREVEGLIIFAKTEEVQKQLKDDWKNVTKKYLALTEGNPTPTSGTIESWLKDGHNHQMVVFQKEVQGSQFAKTEYKVLEQRGKYTLVEVTLHTGRKNQIRVHLSSIKCPIVGDFSYGADKSIKRQVRLCSYYLKFTHPIRKEVVELEYRPKASFFKPSQKDDEKYKKV